MCRYTTNFQTSSIAVQNAGETDATVTVVYYGYNGAVLATHAAGTVKPGAKISINTCDAKVYSKMNGKIGTALIKSTQPIVAIGKINSNNGLSTAYLGQTAGSMRVLLPYVEYSKLTTNPRTDLYIMNTSSTDSAKSVYVLFYYKAADGTFKYQQSTLATPSAPIKPYGYKSKAVTVTGAALDGNGNYLGVVEVISDQPVVVIARVYKSIARVYKGVLGVTGITSLGEDYIGIPSTIP
jgi:hypothetical protein